MFPPEPYPRVQSNPDGGLTVMAAFPPPDGAGRCGLSILTWIGPALAFHSLENDMRSTNVGACPLRGHVDPRLSRFSAGATASVLAIVLLIVEVARPLALGLLASQVAVFAFTAFVSFQWSLWAQIFARLIWPRIAAPAGLEDARPARFAQFIGFVFTALALITFAFGVDVAGYGLTGLAFAMAALNAFTGVCLGCKAYHLIR
jgi:hypothetical protein